MFSRSVAILIGTWFAMMAGVLPLGPAHTVNAIVAGILAAAFSLASLSDDRFRIATAVVGGWVALSPFILPSTLLEEVLTVSWGVTMFVCMIGPFSHKPVVTFVGVPRLRPARVEAEPPSFAKAA
jgi:hypothetical protein